MTVMLTLKIKNQMLRVEKVGGEKTVLKFAGLAKEAEPTES